MFEVVVVVWLQSVHIIGKLVFESQWEYFYVEQQLSLFKGKWPLLFLQQQELCWLDSDVLQRSFRQLLQLLQQGQLENLVDGFPIEVTMLSHLLLVVISSLTQLFLLLKSVFELSLLHEVLHSRVYTSDLLLVGFAVSVQPVALNGINLIPMVARIGVFVDILIPLEIVAHWEPPAEQLVVGNLRLRQAVPLHHKLLLGDADQRTYAVSSYNQNFLLEDHKLYELVFVPPLESEFLVYLIETVAVLPELVVQLADFLQLQGFQDERFVVTPCTQHSRQTFWALSAHLTLAILSAQHVELVLTPYLVLLHQNLMGDVWLIVLDVPSNWQLLELIAARFRVLIPEVNYPAFCQHVILQTT